MKKNKGITLIALVITIIVLLILAGVAISMLSGENGILRKAAEAKTKTEEAQEDEETALIDMELNAHFIEKNSRYRCSYGYITGVTVVNSNTEDKVSKLQEALPSGYKVKYKYEYGADYKTGEDKDITEDIQLMTGMGIVKEDNEKEIVARVVVFGDTNCDGKIDHLNDACNIIWYYGDVPTVPRKDFSVVAMDVNHDGYIGNIDFKIVEEVSVGNKDFNLDDYQKGTATSFKKISKKREIETAKDYISKLEMKDASYKWVEKSLYMRLEGAITADTTGNAVIEGLGLTGKAYVRRDDEETITTQGVQKGDEIVLIDGYEAYGHKIEVLGRIYY